jgi:hypothetical protein
MDEFLDEYDIPKFGQEDVNYQNSSIMSNEIEAVIISE